MTQTAADHTPTTLGLRSVPLSELHEWPANPRQTHVPEAHATLVASIRAQGLLQPLLVRPRMVAPTLTPEEEADDAAAARQHKGKVVARRRVAAGYEVIAGNRRLRALAEIGGDPLVPVLVREMDDDTCIAAAIKENGDRDGLAPLEEARAFAQLIERLDNGYGSGVAGAAALTGKSEQHIRQRLRLLDLCPAAEAFLAAGHLSLGAALLLAQLRDHVDQSSALEDAGYVVDGAEGGIDEATPMAERLPTDGMLTLAQWRTIVSNQGRRLSRAPFPVGLAILTEAGACTACPKRSDAQGALFADATEGVCLDRSCWNEKAAANDRRLLDEAERSGRLLTIDRTSKIWQDWGARPATLHDADWQALDGSHVAHLTLTDSQRKQVRVAVDPNGNAREVIPLALHQELTAKARGAGSTASRDAVDDEVARAKRKAAEEEYRKKREAEAAERKREAEKREKIDAAVADAIDDVSINDEGVMTAIAVAVAHWHAQGTSTADREGLLAKVRAMDDDEAARFALKGVVDMALAREDTYRDVFAALGGETYDDLVARVTAPPKKPRKRAGTAASARAEQEGGAA